MSSHDGADTTVTLPGGLLDDLGHRHQLAELRPITGREEEIMAAAPAGEAMAERVTAVLGRCLTGLGGAAPGPATARQLTVGDREALLLTLRRMTVGDAIDCVLTCPGEGCGERIDLELRVSDLLVAPYPEFPAWYEERVAGAEGDLRVRFRLPRGADQEAVAPLARRDAQAAGEALLARCVAEVTDVGGGQASLDEPAVGALAARMADLDPQAELRLRACCPWCSATIATVFDTAAFLIAEMAANADHFYQEVHALAWHYHWGEREILGLTGPKRRRYLDLIAANQNGRVVRRTA